MSKLLDLNKTVYEIYKEFPEITGILSCLGFKDITKPGMLQTAGRFMTIPKGAAMKKISMDEIKETLEKKGFEIIESEEK